MAADRKFFTEIKDARITILGAEKSGIAAAGLVQKLGGVPFVSDFAKAEKLSSAENILIEKGIAYEFGSHSEAVFNCNFIIISPGVPSDAPPVIKARESGIPVISELAFAALWCKGTIIAISGTNGKSTTTALVEHLLKAAGKYCVAAGNIGIAFSEVTLEIPADGFVSLEVSSFQLDHAAFFKPRAAMLLNITPDHLNRYHNEMREYIEAKYKIFACQDEEDLLILNADSNYLAPEDITTKSRTRYFSLDITQQEGITRENGELISRTNGKTTFRCAVDNIRIRGDHNHANAMAAIEAVLPFIDEHERLNEGLRTFTGIAHRIELVKTISGVQYINDSKATNIDSLWYALRSFDTPIFLILGGIDKGNDYGIIRELVLQKVKKIYAIGQSAEKIFKYFHHDIKVEIKPSLEECVHSANLEARDGDIVLLSPACASFDMFKNFEHRGEMFKEAVMRMEG